MKRWGRQWLRWFERRRRDGFDGRWPLAHRGGLGEYWPVHPFADDPEVAGASVEVGEFAWPGAPGVTLVVGGPGGRVDAQWCYRGRVVFVEMEQTGRPRMGVRWSAGRRRTQLALTIDVAVPITRQVFEDALEQGAAARGLRQAAAAA